MKKRFTLLMVLALLLSFTFSTFSFGQVGINTTTPNTKTALQIISKAQNSGVMIPSLTTAQRDAISTTATEDGLVIYNVDSKCYDFWNASTSSWISICGATKAKFTYSCSNITVNGSYVKGTALNSSNYLSITVNVTSPGSYTIEGSTANGYGFYLSNAFTSAGTYTIQVPGSGKPTNTSAGDAVTLKDNGNASACTSLTVPVLSDAGTYSIYCGSATVNGVYQKGTALSPGTNTITLPVNVTTVGSYSVTTNTVNGISFSGSGTFSATGAQNVTLTGTGTPNTYGPIALSLLTNSSDGAATCNVTVISAYSAKTILHINTTGEGGYGYSANPNTVSGSVIHTTSNFGTLASSTVKISGFSDVDLIGPSDAALQTALASNPDIVIIGYAYNPSPTSIGYLTSYLNKKGVILDFQESAPEGLMRGIFGDQSINTTFVNGGGAAYQVASINDDITNGPFGDVRGLYWGEDASATASLPTSITGSIIPYSYATSAGGATYTGITGFRHSSLNFIWFGDGGFLSNGYTIPGGIFPSTTSCPFATTTSSATPAFRPVAKSGYGSGYTVQNSIIFANAFAWAIKQAQLNGINTK